MHAIFWLENLKRRDHSEELGVDGKIVSEWILGKGWKGMDWMHLALDRDQWWVLVKTVIKLRYP
jgi:hypothetical protein